MKGKLVNLISSVRTLMRSEFFFWVFGVGGEGREDGIGGG